MTPALAGTLVLCTCCPPGRREKLGVLVGDKLAYQDKRHGTTHQAQVEVRDLLAHLAGTNTGSAIRGYVEGLL